MNSILTYINKFRAAKQKGLFLRGLLEGILQWFIANWFYIVVGLLLAGICYYSYRFYRKRKRLASGQAPLIGRKSLLNVWNSFIKGIPREARNSVLQYNPCILLGDSGAGKTSLADNYTDWQGQAKQFYPSHVSDSRVQIYLGSDLWIQEIPHSLLYDISKEAREALELLWRPLVKYHSPHVVIAVDAESLLTHDPKTLRETAQMARGKINVISRIINEPVYVTVALTHMDSIEGFSVFEKFLNSNNIPMRLDVDKTDFSTHESLAKYEEWISTALVQVSAEECLDILGFLQNFSNQLLELNVFTRTLCLSESKSIEPRIDKISLCSNEPLESPASNPFTLPAELIKVKDPNRFHRRVATGFALAGCLYLGACLGSELSTMFSMGKIVDGLKVVNVGDYGAVDPVEYNNWDRELSAYTSDIKRSSFQSFISSSYFQEHPVFLMSEVHNRYQQICRDRILIPKLKGLFEYLLECAELPNKPNGWRESRRQFWELAGVVYSPCSREMADAVQANSMGLARSLNLPLHLIEDYAKLPDGLTRKVITLPFDIRNISIEVIPAFKSYELSEFLEDISETVKKTVIHPEQHEKIRITAAKFLKEIIVYERESLASRFYRNLLAIPGVLSKTNASTSTMDVFRAVNRLKDYLQYIIDKPLALPAVDSDIALGELSRRLHYMLSVIEGLNDEECRFGIGHREYVMNTLEWLSLLVRTRITFLMEQFKGNNNLSDGYFLFSTNHGYPALTQNEMNNGRLFFSGKGYVDGRYTANAIRDILPILEDLPGLMKKLPVEDSVKDEFSRFVVREMEVYAQKYAKAMENYYTTFNVSVSSLPELRYVIQQIGISGSYFQTFLWTMKENTIFDMDPENPYLLSLINHLSVFQFLEALMFERKGSYPELEKYLAIITQLGVDLSVAESLSSDGSEEGGDDASRNQKSMAEETIKTKGTEEREKSDKSTLADFLSPTGLYCFKVLSNPEQSYLGACERFLTSVRIKYPFRRLFIGPVASAYNIGRFDLEATIKGTWTALYREYIESLSHKFPFNKNAESTVTEQEMIDAFHEQGNLSADFRSLIAPVCTYSEGHWKMKPSSLGSVPQPEQMLAMVNFIEDFRKYLWNDRGEPIPMVFNIKTFPLPPVVDKRPSVVLAYMRSGDDSVFAFNQRSLWKELPIKWWESTSSAVGIKIEDPRRGKQSFSAESIVQTDWSFLKLINDAERTGDCRYSWTFKSQQTAYRRYTVEFATETNPFSLFELIPFTREIQNDPIQNFR